MFITFFDIKTYKVYLIWSYKLKVMHFISVGCSLKITRDLFVMETVTGGVQVRKTETRGSRCKCAATLGFSHRARGYPEGLARGPGRQRGADVRVWRCAGSTVADRWGQAVSVRCKNGAFSTAPGGFELACAGVSARCC